MNFLNYILSGADSGSPIVLLLLDLSAAFDKVDHDILIDCLKDKVGFQGLAWIGFPHILRLEQFQSVMLLTCGVPQGSILEPVLFSLYLLP